MKGEYPKRTENQTAGTLELLYNHRIEEIWKEHILWEHRTTMLEPKNCCINKGLKNYERKYPKRTENQNDGPLELLYKQRIGEIWKESLRREQRTNNAGTWELLYKQRIEELWNENILR